MNIDKIRFLTEILTEQMNHWLLYPLALLVAGASRNLTGEGDTMLLAWALCGLFPFFFFLIRMKVTKLFLFVFLHVGVAAFSLLVPTGFPAGNVVCILCAVGYLIYSHVLRLKHDVMCSDTMHLPVGVGLGAVSIFTVHYLNVREWDNLYVFSLIGGIAIYFIIYYIEHYLNFLSINESSAGFLPAREMFHSGMGLVLAYTLLGTGILLLTSQFAWLAGILQPLKNLLFAFLRFLFSGHHAPEEEAEIPAVEEQPQGNMGEMILPETNEPFWLWKVLEFIAIVALVAIVCAVVVLALVKLFRFIRQYRNLHLHKEGSVEDGEAVDLREKCELERSNAQRKRQSLFSALSPQERIRKLYKKKLLNSVPGMTEDDRNRLDIYTAREWESKLESRGMSALYEQARYSGQEMAGSDVKRMKEACK